MDARHLPPRLAADRRGAIVTEYVVVTALVAIATIPAFLLAGAAVARSFVFVRGYMLFPFP
jgi:Flp pilus assembly pilin Flp